MQLNDQLFTSPKYKLKSTVVKKSCLSKQNSVTTLLVLSKVQNEMSQCLSRKKKITLTRPWVSRHKLELKITLSFTKRQNLRDTRGTRGMTRLLVFNVQMCMPGDHKRPKPIKLPRFNHNSSSIQDIPPSLSLSLQFVSCVLTRAFIHKGFQQSSRWWYVCTSDVYKVFHNRLDAMANNPIHEVSLGSNVGFCSPWRW